MSTQAALLLVILGIGACGMASRPSEVVRAGASAPADLPYCDARDDQSNDAVTSLDSTQRAALWQLTMSYLKATALACRQLKGTANIIVHWDPQGVPDRICVSRGTDVGEPKDILCAIHALSTVTTPSVLRSAMHHYGGRVYPYNVLDAFYSPDEYQMLVKQCREDCLDDKPCVEQPDGEVGPPK